MNPHDSSLFSLPVAKYVLSFEAMDKSSLSGLETSLRGQLGFLLKARFCPFINYRNRQCQNCPHAADCLYPILFAPLSLCINQEYLGNTKCPEPPPRPFALGVFGADSQGVLYPGEQGVIELTLIGSRAITCRRPMLESLWLAFDALPGQDRGEHKVALQPLEWNSIFPIQRDNSWALNSEEVFLDTDGESVDPESLEIADWIAALKDPHLGTEGNKASRLTLEFITPVQSKKIKDCSFIELVRAITGRLKDLKRVYCNDNDMRLSILDLFKKAEQVRVVEKDIMTRRKRCYSYRQGKEIYLDGLMGRICYEGQIEPFIPVLKAGTLIGIGNKLSYGLGRISMS